MAAIVCIAAVSAADAMTIADYGPFTCNFYDNGDSNGTYTGAANWTPEQRADVAASIAAWDSMILNTAGRQISVDLFWADYSGSILGGSQSPSNGDGTNAWNYGEHVWRDGVNYSAPWGGWDTLIRLDTDAAGYAWNFGSDAPGGSQIDFRSVVTHEIGHSLGFSDSHDPSPIYDDWGNTYGTEGSPYAWAGYNGLTAWDQNLVDSAGNRPENGSKGDPGNFNQVDDPIYWDGSEAVAYYGDNVPIYAPNPYEDGSSLSHLDQDTFPNALMSPYISLGAMGRSPTDLEWAMMRDMGWSVAPEPGSLVMLTGLAGMSLVWWRRRRKQGVGRAFSCYSTRRT